jgi:hypothetical protein
LIGNINMCHIFGLINLINFLQYMKFYNKLTGYCQLVIYSLPKQDIILEDDE